MDGRGVGLSSSAVCPAPAATLLPDAIPVLLPPPVQTQITRIVSNIRPDRQTVMFSATFPRAVETLARQILDNPVEIQVGVVGTRGWR